MTFGITVQKKEVWNIAKHGLEDVSVVWLFMLALYVHQNGSDGAIFHLSCECWISSWEKALRTWQTVFWKVFLLFGDSSKSSRLPCMCVKIVPKGICFFSDVIRTWQHMVWKAFLLFCDLCQFLQVASIFYMHQHGLGVFFHFLVVVGI